MKNILKNFNYLQFVAILALATVGTFAIWSAGNARAELVFHGMWLSNLATVIFGLILYFIIAAIDYRKIFDWLSLPGYLLVIAMLIAVLVFGSTVYGGRRWLWFFQPSEISKLWILIFIATLLGRDYERFSVTGFKCFMLIAVVIGVPCLLILAEPDLGTTLTLVPAVMVMMFTARVWLKGLIVLTATAAIMALTVLGAVYEAEKPGTSIEHREKILKYVPLKEHQVKRVKVFLFPDEDIDSAGYNLRQAKIAIGSGGFSGKGLGKGEANHLKYLPQTISMNDFIFCVYAEETGYLGSLVLLALFALLLLPGCWVAYRCEDARGRLFALGFSTLLFAHVYINIAMSIGLVPITGLPLPFISSGRTFLVTAFCGLGFIQSISIYRKASDWEA